MTSNQTTRASGDEIRTALAACGGYDRDNPSPLFARVRDRSAAYPSPLADGHHAWLIVRYQEARAALNDARLSKDIHAALATGADVVAEGRPGFLPAHAQRPPEGSHRLRRLVQALQRP